MGTRLHLASVVVGGACGFSYAWIYMRDAYARDHFHPPLVLLQQRSVKRSDSTATPRTATYTTALPTGP